MAAVGVETKPISSIEEQAEIERQSEIQELEKSINEGLRQVSPLEIVANMPGSSAAFLLLYGLANRIYTAKDVKEAVNNGPRESWFPIQDLSAAGNQLEDYLNSR